jgi:hypothetical protein
MMNDMHDIWRRPALILCGLMLVSQSPLAHVPAPSTPPGFAILLQAEPIVVVASVEKFFETSTKNFEAIPGDYDSAPAFSEEYQHYILRTRRILKGKLPDTFELRLIRGSRNHALIDRALGREMLLVLAPDLGLDQQGKPRDTFLVVFGAVEDKNQTAVWSVERAANVIAKSERERDWRRAESPEPRDAAVGVFSGEVQAAEEEKQLPEAPDIRKSEILPEDVLATSAPKAIEGALGGEESNQKTGN